MTETGITTTITDPKPHDDGHFRSYLIVFALLCGFTAVSFVCNELERHDKISKHASLAMIMGVAVIKAVCVAVIFMHLKQDWGKVYFIVIPVTVMGIMMMIVFCPDILIAWHHVPVPPLDGQP
jgi:caa(3)-type oxidase subunit IV